VPAAQGRAAAVQGREGEDRVTCGVLFRVGKAERE